MSKHLKLLMDCYVIDDTTGSIREYLLADRKHLIYKPDNLPGGVKGESYSVPPDDTLELSSVDGTCFVLVSCSQPLNVRMNIDNTQGEIDFGLQTCLSLSVSAGSSIIFYNSQTVYIPVTIIRLGNEDLSPTYASRALYTVSALSRIFMLPAPITNINKVSVQDVTLETWTNDQLNLPSTITGNKYRVCDANGDANPNGQYIMLLNDLVTQQNFSGTLKMWVSESV